MTPNEANDLIADYHNLLEEATGREMQEGPGAGDDLREEAKDLAQRLRAAGYDPLEST